MSTKSILAAIDDTRRVETPKQLVGYAGLGARVHNSGESQRGGRITRAG